jgi:CRP-like cAMP-binding protein
MEFNFEANFFTLLQLLDAGSRLEVEGACTDLSLPPNEVVYAQGDPANSVYIVVSGRVEAFTQSPDGKQTRTVGIMAKGDFFGDLAVLTGHPRLAGIRTCEATKLLQIEKLAFIRLLEKVPKVGAFFARNLARRLHQTSTEAHVSVYSIDLAGNLEHFDLLVIFYSIFSSGRTGELQLYNSGNEVIGSFFFREGRLENALYLHLTGMEAVWQGIVQAGTVGTFMFRLKSEPSSPYPEDQKIEMESNELLAQGVTCREAYQAIPESLRLMSNKISHAGAQLVWTDADTQPLAERIWELIAKRPQPLDSVWRRLNVSAVTFLEIVNHLVNTGQVEVVANEPPPETL